MWGKSGRARMAMVLAMAGLMQDDLSGPPRTSRVKEAAREELHSRNQRSRQRKPNGTGKTPGV